MPNYVKDEINFHIFLNAMRDLHMVSLDRVCEGLCSASMVKRIKRLYYIIKLIEVSELLVKEAECCFNGMTSYCIGDVIRIRREKYFHGSSFLIYDMKSYYEKL